MSSLVHLLRIAVCYLIVLLWTRYIHKRIYNDELDVKTSLLCQQLLQNRVLVKLIILNSSICSNLVCLNTSNFEASESVSPISSMNLAFDLSSFLPFVCLCHSPCHLWALLSSPDYPLIIIIALSLCSFPHPSAYPSLFRPAADRWWPLHLCFLPQHVRSRLVGRPNYLGLLCLSYMISVYVCNAH